ncbi:MAG: MFS transporter, partial [Frankia sp.]|nr:MFS transporter [Frankia sp.]
MGEFGWAPWYRWLVLAAGTLAQASTSAFFQGLAAVGPALRDQHGLTLGGLGLLLACPTIGVLATLLPWGPVVDRYGERPAMTVGLSGAASCLLGAGLSEPVAARAVLLVAAGAFGGSVNAASGRAVMTWFPADRRGVAMGIRQCAIPAGSAFAAAGLPPLVAALGVDAAFDALAVGCALACVAVLVVIREPPRDLSATPSASGSPAVARETRPRPAAAGSTRAVLADRRLWRLSLAAGLMIVPQFTMIVFLVEVLHDGRGMSAQRAAAVLTLAAVLGAVARIGAGAWSDRARARVRPMRTVAVGCVVGMSLAALAVAVAPVGLLAVVLVLVSAVTVCWNGLAFTAAGELAPPGRAATAMSFETSANFASSSLTPPLVGLLIGATGWSRGFLLVTLAPLVAALLLRPLLEPRRAASPAA